MCLIVCFSASKTCDITFKFPILTYIERQPTTECKQQQTPL